MRPSFMILLCGLTVLPLSASRGQDAGASGEQAFNNSCRTCHTVKDGDNRAGPNLHNIIGRKAGSVANYRYSEAMKSSDIVWDEDRLLRFIEDPDALVSGNGMKPYTGVRSAEDRAGIVAFLKSPGK
ncbi:c-type cytochrome [Bradyrhizobium septentrionale]|uniref:C-type cytochrome n=2 Tax=Bradyrhizobium septentrionale TaxID=1404411 RepID=A0ABZ2P257_9BRAD|nr:c-type cytochrome [Bradyrhizobium septentrionale]UGY18338.1 c-type cytochrome [Bradyrhizobium septentrionale]UGY27034.1 c-type cytochrome [Bradyrhizobium septentrionale]